MCDSFIDDNDDLAVATCYLPRATFYFPLGRQRQHVKTDDWGHPLPLTAPCVVCQLHAKLIKLICCCQARDRFA